MLQQQQQPWNRVYLYTGANDSAPHKPIGELVNRATFLMPDKRAIALADDEDRSPPMARLVIEEPRQSDEALYKCDVTYVKGKCPSISLVRVQIMSLPAKAQIVMIGAGAADGASEAQSASLSLADGQLIGPHNEHDQLRLACLVYGGKPAPKSVFWRKIEPSGRTINLVASVASGKLSPGRQSVSGGGGESALEVQLNYTLTSADLGAKFECHVEHEALEPSSARVVVNEATTTMANKLSLDATLDLHPARQPPVETVAAVPDDQMDEAFARPARSLDSHVFIDLNVGVSSLDLFMAKMTNKRNSSEPLREGDLIELECIAYNSKPPANITWFNGSDAIEQLDASLGVQPSSSSNSGGGGATNGDNGNNKWQLRQRHKRLLQRNLVQKNGDGQTFNTHSFLSVKLSRHEHRAQITCQAQNAPMRQPTSKSLELQVQHVPIVLMEPAAGVAITELSSAAAAAREPSLAMVVNTNERQDGGANKVTIYCIYSANPIELLPNSTRWFRDGEPLVGVVRGSLEPARDSLPHLVESYTPTGYPVLTINRPNRHDAGSYDCQLANEAGQSERLPASEACRLEVNFRPAVQLRTFKPLTTRKQEQPQRNYAMEDLIEVDLNQELILPGSAPIVLVCEVLEARPNRIHKFQWYSSRPAAKVTNSGLNKVQMMELTRSGQPQAPTAEQKQLAGVTETGQFVLNSLGSNFTRSAFTCVATNSIGASDQSNQIELQLSYQPGPSFVRPVSDASLRRTILASGRQASHAQPGAANQLSDNGQITTVSAIKQQQQEQPLVAGREFMLECVTIDPGKPLANTWHWFKDGQPIESSRPKSLGQQQQQQQRGNNLAEDENDLILATGTQGNGPIAGRAADLSETSRLTIPSSSRGSQRVQQRNDEHEESSAKIRGQQYQQEQQYSRPELAHSGRYLFIPSIQLAHKGNYSCVAINRFGSGPRQQSSAASSSTLERDSYQIRVALAPSFVQPLAPRTYWSESAPKTLNSGSQSSAQPPQLTLSCMVQCEPICHIEWLRNNEPLDLRRQTENEISSYLTHQVKQIILEENVEANLFKSVESKLVLQFHNLSSNGNRAGDRERILDRRRLLNDANYTCQSSSNSMGPPVRSTTKFVVQYPPENVLISAPSDKLRLVEGSNGPRLSCEAMGEPQVQYRWFLMRGGGKMHPTFDGGFSNTISATKLSTKHSNPISTASAGGENLDPTAIDQAMLGGGNGETELAASIERGANDVASTLDQNQLIELTGSAIIEQIGGSINSISTLDLSNLSLDRRQAGHYFCEASNRLGQTRQSVHVNVLYKPTCATLHLHSLDLTIMPSLDLAGRATSPKEEGLNQVRARPFEATSNDEYSLVRETSHDFIDLRKILVLSPLLNRYGGVDGEGTDELSFKGSIFQTILDTKSSSMGEKYRPLKDTDALINTDESVGDNEDQSNSLLGLPSASGDNYSPEVSRTPQELLASLQNGTSKDSWDKFNLILLKYLNNYIDQVKSKYNESQRIGNPLVNSVNQPTHRDSTGDRRQNRRSSLSTADGENSARSNERKSMNFLTFACMPKDANPTNNLTFNWSFGSKSLPETRNATREIDQLSYQSAVDKPMVIYVNENYTVNVILVRRLDTRSSLNPFQMSLLTLNIVVAEPTLTASSKDNSPTMDSATRPSDGVPSTNESDFNAARDPVIRSRYHQSLHNSLRPYQNGNNIQFSHEFDAKPYNLGPLTLPDVALDEKNWQEQIGNLLKCSITNSIGTSEVCYVKVNSAERLKSQDSSSEFAKWRMPSLAHKSLLIISIMIGCALIIFATLALLIGPYLKGLNLKQADDVHGKDKNNTGQSTSSQKSSVMGLLGTGDSSTQGSSDDDSSARLNHLESMNKVPAQDRMADLAMSRSVANGYHSHHSMREPSINYDQPRGLQDSRLVYHNSGGLFNESSSDRPSTIGAGAYDDYEYRAKRLALADNQTFEKKMGPELKPVNQASAGSRLLANLKLKSLTNRFKVDRISDLSNFTSRMENLRNLHNKTVSNSGTNTTGLSGLENEQSMSKIVSPNLEESPGFFRTKSIRRNIPGLNQSSQSSYYMYDQNGLDQNNSADYSNQMLPLSSQRLMSIHNTLDPAYSNTMYTSHLITSPTSNVMDDFIRQREIVDHNEEGHFYRSRSTREQPVAGHQSMYMLKDDINQFYPSPMNRGPPIYPRTHVNPAMMYGQPLPIQDIRPPQVATRSIHRNVTTNLDSIDPNQPYQAPNNRYSMPSYNQMFSANNVVENRPAMNFSDTIDTHLNRLPDTLTLSGVSNLDCNHQIAYANAINNSTSSYGADPYNRDLRMSAPNQSEEHIYDLNTYATPEQTPLKRPNSIGQAQTQSSSGKERPRVSQLIQTFNSKLPE